MTQLLSFLDEEVPQFHGMEQKEYLDFEVILDSGAADHAVDSAVTPGYPIQGSAGIRAGACFVAANGERIPNKGDFQLDLRAGSISIKSTFQMSKVSRPFLGVGKVCAMRASKPPLRRKEPASLCGHREAGRAA